KPFHAPAAECIHAHPLELKRSLGTQHRFDARDHPFRLALELRIGVPAELEVDAPDIVGLSMQQRRLPWVERRVEPEPALGRENRLHFYIRGPGAIAENPAARPQ